MCFEAEAGHLVPQAGQVPDEDEPMKLLRPKPQPDRILRIHEVRKRTGLSRTTIWRMARKKKFPRAVQLSEFLRGWKESEIAEWINSRPRTGDSQDDI